MAENSEVKSEVEEAKAETEEVKDKVDDVKEEIENVKEEVTDSADESEKRHREILERLEAIENAILLSVVEESEEKAEPEKVEIEEKVTATKEPEKPENKRRRLNWR